MGRPLINLINKRFGRLVVIEYLGRQHHSSRWKCQCDCGNQIDVNATSLKLGNSLSCGCFRRERMSKINLRHGMSGTPEHKAWDGMLQRCKNPKAKGFSHYGGRGIKVCDRWLSFEAFIADLGPKPSGAHSLERIDVNGDYDPVNCRWATAKEQCRNKRNNKLVSVNGDSVALSEAAERLGLPYKTLKSRIQKGWDADRALNTPVNMSRVNAQRNRRHSDKPI